MKRTSIPLILMMTGFILSLAGCDKLDLAEEVPSCIEKKIRKYKREDLRSPPAKVWRWEVDGQTYYYIPFDECCIEVSDGLSALYDEKCNRICAPDGGLSGGGDGNCPDFINTIEWTLVWEDDRE